MARIEMIVVVVVALSLLAAGCTSGLTGGDDDARSVDGPAGDEQAGGDTDNGHGDDGGSFPDSMYFGSGPDIDGVTPPDDTPIDASADMRTGRLDNGLAYYIMENDAPGRQVELLLTVNAGSAQQPVPDSGNAHFLEHMMFNGTEEYPINELDAVLRRLGVEIGPDLNAYTSFDETVYQLSMPAVDDANLELGLRVLAQWAGSATINQDDVEAERGVVREEHRLRNESGSAEITQTLFEHYTTNSGYENHLPIGSPDQILATNSAELKAFYDDWYRPDNMAIIAVGDIDPDTVERLIKQELSGLTDRGSTPPRQPVVSGPLTEPIIEVLTAEGGPEPSISLDYLWPSWDPETVGGQRMLLADQLIATMLSAYLNELAAEPELDIIRPFAEVAPVARGRRLLGMNVASDDYGRGPTDLIRAMRTAEVNGFEQHHFDLAVRQALAAVDQAVAAEPSKQDFQHAEEITEHVLTGAPIENIEAWAARSTDQIESFTLDELNRIFQWEMSITVPILALLGSDPDELPTQAELEAAFAEGLAAEPLTNIEATEIDQLLARPDGPDPSTEGEIFANLTGTYQWQFDNGVQVLFWESTIAASQVDVLIVGGNGRQSLTIEESALADLAVNAVTSSGVADVNQITLDRYLSERQVFVAPFIDTRFQGVSASAAADDIDVMFELLHGYLTVPRVDSGGLAEARNQAESDLRSMETEPGFASFVAERLARFENEPNLFAVPTERAVDTASEDDLLAIFTDQFGGDAPLTVLITGDVDRDDLEKSVVDYLGSLPDSRAAGAGDDRLDYPPGPQQLTVSAGRNDAGAGFDRTYTAPGSLTSTELLQAELVVAIINDRLFSRVREELGASYGGGQAGVETGYLNSGDTTLRLSVDGDPARLDEIKAAVDDELVTLMTNGPQAEDLAEAKAVLSNDLQFVTNFDLLILLLDSTSGGAQADPFADTTVVTNTNADDVAQMARRLMADELLIEVTRLPAG